MVSLLIKSNEEAGYSSPQSTFYAGMGFFLALCYVYLSYDAVFTGQQLPPLLRARLLDLASIA